MQKVKNFEIKIIRYELFYKIPYIKLSNQVYYKGIKTDRKLDKNLKNIIVNKNLLTTEFKALKNNYDPHIKCKLKIKCNKCHLVKGSIWFRTMEAGCIVVDFDIAKKVIEDNLKNTEFGDYSRIFKMNEE